MMKVITQKIIGTVRIMILILSLFFIVSNASANDTPVNGEKDMTARFQARPSQFKSVARTPYDMIPRSYKYLFRQVSLKA